MNHIRNLRALKAARVWQERTEARQKIKEQIDLLIGLAALKRRYPSPSERQEGRER